MAIGVVQTIYKFKFFLSIKKTGKMARVQGILSQPECNITRFVLAKTMSIPIDLHTSHQNH